MRSFENLNEFYDLGMGINEFRALYRVNSLVGSSRFYLTFRSEGRWPGTLLQDFHADDRDWQATILRASGNWEGGISDPRLRVCTGFKTADKFSSNMNDVATSRLYL